MQELINPNTYQVGETVILHKFPNAAARIAKVNKATLTVILSSVDQSVDNRMFNIKPADIYQHWARSKNN